MERIVCLLLVLIAAVSPAPNPEILAECTNFYDSACPRSEKDMYNLQETIVTNNFNLMMKTWSFGKSSVEAKILNYYHNCNRGNPNIFPDQLFERFIKPFVVKADSWFDLTATSQRNGFSGDLIALNVIPNSKAPKEYIIEIRRPIFFHGDDDNDNSIQQNSDINKRIMWNKQFKDFFDERVEVMSVFQLYVETGLDWKRFFETIRNHSIPEDFKVQVRNLDYFKCLKELMDTYENGISMNYTSAKLVERLGKFLSTRVDCTKDVRLNLNLAWNFLYLERSQDPAIQEVKDLFEDLRKQLLQQIEINHFGLSAEQREWVAGKVRDLSLSIGNLPKTSNLRSYVSQYYENLDFPWNSDFNIDRILLQKFRFQKMISQLDGRKSEELTVLPPELDAPPFASYMPITNVIFLPYEFILPPYHSSVREDVSKYSLMGFTLAQKMIYAVGINGIFVDIYSNYSKEWRMPQMEKALDLIYDRRFTESYKINSYSYRGFEPNYLSDTEQMDVYKSHKIFTKIMKLPLIREVLEKIELNEDQSEETINRIANLAALHLVYSAYEKRLTDIGESSDSSIFLDLAKYFCEFDGVQDFVNITVFPHHLQEMLNHFKPFKNLVTKVPHAETTNPPSSSDAPVPSSSTVSDMASFEAIKSKTE